MSVGLPVYNGERYLREAIVSILAQSHDDLELVISDNGSTDGTEVICREIAARDPRVRYHREPVNRGAVWNFNRVLQLARGEFFMWQAFDDVRHPECIARCVEQLHARPDAVHCCAGVVVMDEDGVDVPAGEWPPGIPPIGVTPEERLSQIARAEYWYDFYGLARRSALAHTPGCRSVWGFDVVLLLELCLLGPVVLAEGPLFRYRVFRRKTQTEVAGTLSGQTVATIPDSWTELAVELRRAIARAPLPPARRRALTAQLGREFFRDNPTFSASLTADDARAAAARAWKAGRYADWLAFTRVGAPVRGAAILRRFLPPKARAALRAILRSGRRMPAGPPTVPSARGMG